MNSNLHKLFRLATFLSLSALAIVVSLGSVQKAHSSKVEPQPSSIVEKIYFENTDFHIVGYEVVGYDSPPVVVASALNERYNKIWTTAGALNNRIVVVTVTLPEKYTGYVTVNTVVTPQNGVVHKINPENYERLVR